MEKSLKSTGFFAASVAAIFLILGILMVAKPDTTLEIVSLTAGIIFLATGIIKVIDYFVLKGNYDFYNYELVHGLVAFAIGTIILAYTREISALFVALIGIWITYSGLMSLNIAMKLQATKIGSWIPVFIMSLIMMIGGLYIVAYPTSAVILVGIVVIVYALIELVENVIFLQNVEKMYSDEKETK